MTRRLLLIIASVCILFLKANAQYGAVTVKEYNKIFTTYPFSDPDPVGRMTKIYPYFRYDGFTDKPVEKEWKVVQLENDFIRIMILPEVGGKIWSATEKNTGKEFLYYNHVVKFRDVAMRGPWTSGGLEANYGIIGHTPNCATPVDYVVRKNDDGSISCIIGVLDLLTRTPWRLEIKLEKDKAYFETSSFWFNSTPLEEPYYTWMNAGIKATGNLQFVYPGNNYLGHEGEYADWSINKSNGKDITFYEQNNFGGYKSYHVFGKYTDFFGAFWHNDDFGMGRYAMHDDKAGKKIWIWGLSRQGMIWDKLLTDADGQYVEVQSGRLFNQSADKSTLTPFKHKSFPPYSTDKWTEYWFPVVKTKGLVKANNQGVLNIKSENGWLKIWFSSLQSINDKITISNLGSIIYSKQIKLNPLQLFSDSIKTDIAQSALTVVIGDHKLEYNSDPNDGVLDRPLESPKTFDWESVYGLYLQGKENIRQKYYPEAEVKLLECLKKDPNFMPALTDLSMLMVRTAHYTEGYNFARRALAIDTYDGAANYYYALNALALRKLTDAKDGFDIAALSPEYRGAAYTALSEISLKSGDLDKTLIYIEKGLDNNRNNLNLLQYRALVYRMKGNTEKAGLQLNQISEIDPLNHFAHFEKYLLDHNEETAKNFTSLIRNELPHETYLELAIWYYRLGLNKEAEKVFEMAPANAEILYWQAYLSYKAGRDYHPLITKATNASPHLVFPFRTESTEVLKWASTISDDWHPTYYLALISMAQNDSTQAIKLLTTCGNKPDYAPFYASRGLLSRSTHPNEALVDFKKAAQLSPNEWRYGKLTIELLVNQQNYNEALNISNIYHSRLPNHMLLNMLHARVLMLNQKYKESIEILSKLQVIPFEGSTEGRQLWREDWLLLAVEQMHVKQYAKTLKSIERALEWPENLGVGKPYPEDIDVKAENWLKTVCTTRMNNSKTKSIENDESIIRNLKSLMGKK
ncbi:MAG: DUF5107 domain-containing protein [Bacteroidetes bacterium]|nr:DUF5107 domain-containing protein [Bacteroidota bacterium]